MSHVRGSDAGAVASAPAGGPGAGDGGRQRRADRGRRPAGGVGGAGRVGRRPGFVPGRGGRRRWLHGLEVAADPAEVVDRFRRLVAGLVGPLVARSSSRRSRGCWPIRCRWRALGRPGRCPTPAGSAAGGGEGGGGRSAWGLVRLAAIAAAVAGSLRSYAPEFARLGILEADELARLAGSVLWASAVPPVDGPPGPGPAAWSTWPSGIAGWTYAAPDDPGGAPRGPARRRGGPRPAFAASAVAQEWRRHEVEPPSGPRPV